MASLAVNGISQPNGVLTNGDAPPAKGAKEAHSRNPSSYSAKFNIPPHFVGGNHLSAAPAGSVKDFVANNDGHTVISNVRSHFEDLTGLWKDCTRLTVMV